LPADGYSTPRVLVFCDRAPDAHGLGGTQLHAAALLRGSGPGASVWAAYPLGDRLVVAPAVGHSVEMQLGASQVEPLAPWPALERALEASLLGLAIDVLMIEAPGIAPRALAAAIDATGVRAAVTLHDHALVCENHELLELGERYCDLPADRGRCDRCLAQTRRRAAGYLERWRTEQARLLERCDAVVAPSDSVLATVARIHPSIAARARRIDWGVVAPAARCDPQTAFERPLRVAVVGVLAKVKGAERLPELIRAASALDVEWHLFGATEGRSLAAIRRAGARVVVHGAYPRSRLAERIVRARCQIGLLPSIAPESFSLALSEIVACGLPVIASDLGALRGRVSADELGWTFDPWQPAELARLLQRLVAEPALIEGRMRRLAARPLRDERAMLEEHVALWRELGARGPRSVPDAETVSAARRAWADAAGRPRHAARNALARWLGAIRSSEWYRDLPLRGLLPEAWRARFEATILRARLGSGPQPTTSPRKKAD